ncbi:hypothetical protein [Streptomyces sp. NPDC096311]|uniref:hypothetical protein n=1 Tax=Streptomyces sp. NPDC096311 TaxID=3366083 RepID=UPI003812D3E5
MPAAGRVVTRDFVHRTDEERTTGLVQRAARAADGTIASVSVAAIVDAVHAPLNQAVGVEGEDAVQLTVDGLTFAASTFPYVVWYY